MQQFDRIFKNKLDQNSEEKTPVLCMLQDYYQCIFWYTQLSESW